MANNGNNRIDNITYRLNQIGLDANDPFKQPSQKFFGSTSRFGDDVFRFTFEPADPMKELAKRANAMRIEPTIRKVDLKTWSQWQAFANQQRAEHRARQDERWN